MKITGGNLAGTTAVAFGSASATSFTVISATSITAISPAEPAGKVNVTVTTSAGTSAISSADRFKFVPTVTALSPKTGPEAGGTTVTVTGTGFGAGSTATKFRFGKAFATAVNCGSSTTCTVVAPVHEAGVIDVKATVNKVSSPKNRPADQFCYLPSVSAWDLTQGYAAHPQENPLSDESCSEVWSWMYGEADTPSSYALLAHFVSPKTTEKECGANVKEFYEWLKLPERYPGISYNAGPTVERGQTPCAPSAEFPTKSVLVGPGVGTNQYAVFRWKSPITGTVTVSGSIECTDSNVRGIIWELDQASTILLGPTEKADNTLTSFGPLAVSVIAGEALYLEIGPGIRGGAFDTTTVTLHISS